MSLLIILLFIVLAIQATKAAIKQYHNTNRLFKEGIRIQGLVVKLNTHIETNIGTLSEYPVIQFTTADGTLMEVGAKSQLSVLCKGEKIIIYYDPGNPKNSSRIQNQVV